MKDTNRIVSGTLLLISKEEMTDYAANFNFASHYQITLGSIFEIHRKLLKLQAAGLFSQSIICFTNSSDNTHAHLHFLADSHEQMLEFCSILSSLSEYMYQI